jgi:DNA repair protein SbcD/Mre11
MEAAMSTWPFRFIHAGDFHLGRPLGGVSEVPDHLRDLFLDAPYTAARLVFEAALVEDVNFVVLSGGIVNPAVSGPRGPLFLAEQCTRLAERGIGVYWAGSLSDPAEAWPASVRLPKSMHIFSCGQVEEVLVQSGRPAAEDSPDFRGGETGIIPFSARPLARLAGVSCTQRRPWRTNEFQADAAGLYTIAVASGEVDLAVLQNRGLHYWALGGRADRSTPQTSPQTVHYCGTPQGRRPDETGIHGCTLVQIDEQRQTRTSLIPTDAVRWMSERVLVDEMTAAEDLEARLRERMHTLLESMPTVGLLVSWKIAGRGPLLGLLRRGALGGELLDRLRVDYGYRSPPAWSVSLDVELSDTLPPEWYEQETIRGDFLRAIRQLQMNREEPITLEQYLAEPHRAGTLATAVALSGKSNRDSVLREAAALGVDLLSGEETHS